MNNFYFSQVSLVDFAGEFVKRGGKVLLIDQVFKLPGWSQDLRTCYERYPPAEDCLQRIIRHAA